MSQVIVKNYGKSIRSKLLNIAKNKDVYMDQQGPISIMEMPYTIDLRALLAYAKARGVAVFNLSEEDKLRFLIPNSQYQTDLDHSVSSR